MRDRILSVWQSGQYRDPVIKPVPVKHPAIIDECPPGRGEAVIRAEGTAKGGIFAWIQYLCPRVHLREIAQRLLTLKQRPGSLKLIGFSQIDLLLTGSTETGLKSNVSLHAMS